MYMGKKVNENGKDKKPIVTTSSLGHTAEVRRRFAFSQKKVSMVIVK
jgi:hypothetical protein